MVIYPIPVEVTLARVQLVVDQNAKAPPHTTISRIFRPSITPRQPRWKGPCRM
mgnify:CR=1 FL=1